MGHVDSPFSQGSNLKPPDERERNWLMAYFDAMLCFIGTLTTILGVWLDGLSPLLVYLGAVSLLMGYIAVKRFERERDMANH